MTIFEISELQKLVFLICVCYVCVSCGAENEALSKKYSDLFDPSTFSMVSSKVSGNSLSKITEVIRKEIEVIRILGPRNNATFSTWGPGSSHMKAVTKLEKLFKNEADQDIDKMLLMAKDLRGVVNSKVWISALQRVSLHDKRLQAIERPSALVAMPDLFLPTKVLQEAEAIKNGKASKSCAVFDETVCQGAGEADNKLWYLREDLMANSHHWHYHVSYPMDDPIRGRPDRRGEIFYFIHHVQMARYKTERFANGLPEVKSIDVVENTVIPEPYETGLNNDTAGKLWAKREPNGKLVDVLYDYNDDDPSIPSGTKTKTLTVKELSTFHKNLIEAIKNGYLIDKNGSHIPLNNSNGIDWVAEALENTAFMEINPALYATATFGFHNIIHTHLGLIADPMRTLKLPPGPLLQAAVSFRDPLFFRIHKTVDDLFILHKERLPPYEPRNGEFSLGFPGVQVQGIEIDTKNGKNNQFDTFWDSKDITLPHFGADFSERDAGTTGPFHICIKHLNHEPFKVKVKVNRLPEAKVEKVTVRVYMAPSVDGHGKQIPIQEQFQLFFPLFVKQGVSLQPGSSTITLEDKDSDVTVEWPRSLSTVQRDTKAVNEKRICGCGWPQHLMLPKGTPEGQLFDLFVMLTNGEEDKVTDAKGRVADSNEIGCKPAHVTCGIPGQKYPDRKPMGYPFDRRPNVNGSLESWAAQVPNMKILQVKIKFSEKR